MIVMKFGGTSLGDAPRVRQVAELVRARLAERPVVVVSAHAGVTDAILEQSRMAVRGEHDLAPLLERHRQLAADLDVDVPELDELLQELGDLLRGVSWVRELTPRVLDLASSYGERLSSRLVAAFLQKGGIPARAVMADEAGLRTDSRFGRARPLPESDAAIRDYFDQGPDTVPVVTGFIGGDADGNITTLGRNGSDYSAALFGKALGVGEIQIWTDVPGVMTADPRIVAHARPLEVVAYDVAAEFAFYGASVLHPATLVPAIEADIPVRVLDTRQPEAPGTLVLREQGEPSVRAICHKRGISLLDIVSPRMLGHHGFMAKVFHACDRHEVSLDMIATTEISVSATVDDDRNLDALVADVSRFSEVTVNRNITAIAVVGPGVGESTEILGELFRALSTEGVPIRMTSMGARRTNIGIVVEAADTERAVSCLHDALLGDVRSTGAAPGS